MNRRRFLAIIMSVFMILSLLPVSVFAETTAVTLDGQLKIQGTVAAGTTLKADMQGIKNEGITEDSVSYQWFRKTSDDEKKEQQGEKPELKSLSKEKTYTITKDDIDSKIVLTITGLEDKGFSGSLTAVTATVTEAADPKAAETEQNTEASEEEQNQDAAEDDSSEETQEIPEATNDDEAGSFQQQQMILKKHRNKRMRIQTRNWNRANIRKNYSRQMRAKAQRIMDRNLRKQAVLL